MKALLFDFGGTLDSDGIAWKNRFAAALRDQGTALARQKFDAAFYAADDALSGKVPGSLSLAATVSALAGNLSRELPEVASDLVVTAGQIFLANARRCLSRNRPVVARLSTRFRLAVVSNSYGNIDGILDDSGLSGYFEAAIDSSIVGATKPDPRIFRAALDALHVKASEAVMIGDSLARDMQGARAIGIPHVWLRAASSNGSPCCPGDAVIGSLPELESLLP